MYHFETPSQFQFPEYVESQYNHNDLVFYDYFYVPELSVGTKLSFVDPSQFEIFYLDAHMLITANLKYAENNEFVDPHEEIIANEQPITMQSI